tara:strand:- start:767 stop:1054 length:288 start_codon:yes stop_codon:yes gene_type:complete
MKYHKRTLSRYSSRRFGLNINKVDMAPVTPWHRSATIAGNAKIRLVLAHCEVHETTLVRRSVTQFIEPDEVQAAERDAKALIEQKIEEENEDGTA